MTSNAGETNPGRRDDIERICQAALDRDPQSRAAFLAQACAGDSALRRDVESLLAQELSAAGFMEAVALDGAAAGFLSEPGAAIGESIGPYLVLSVLGVGGMGEVYRARDTRLDREVALKVLPRFAAHDPAWLARFDREAKILASLSHPNIAAIYGFEDSSRFPALALELVEGPTLAERIAQGPIPLDEALPLARQIADALEAAHDRGVVHRDLKPANVKLRPDGVVKVLDFGLAKVVEPTSLSPSPGLGMTASGMILGTGYYMSPEQARGRGVDRRSDVWGFGCVLFEMLTGTRAFAGADVAATIVAVLSKEPDWSALPAATPDAIRRLLHRALTKDPRNRLSDASVARLEIDEASSKPQGEASAAVVEPAARRRWRAGWVLAAAAASAVVSLSVAARYARGPAASGEPARFLIDTPPVRNPYVATISPDGRTIAYVGQEGGGTMVYLRRLDSVTARPLAGTEDAFDVFWSPDSRSIVAALGFGPGSTLRIVDAAGGPPRSIARCGAGTVNRDGVVICWNGETLSRVSTAGGPLTSMTTLDQSLDETGHRFPYFLPDGRHFLYLAWSTRPENRAIYLGALDSDRKTRIMSAESRVVYVDPGFLLFHRRGTLFAQAFDATRLALEGEPVRLPEVIESAGNGNGAFSASATGTLVYRPPTIRQLAWFDRQGRLLGNVGTPGSVGSFALSPDEKKVAFPQAGPGASNADIWILDLSTGISDRLTTDPASESEPVWAPDGQTLLFASDRQGDTAVFQRALRDRDDVPVLVSKEWRWPDDWSRDGRYLLINEQNAGILALSATGDRPPVGRLRSDATIDEAKFSPDGRWVAYASTESGQTEIRVASFPDFKASQQVSTGGGNEPQWRDDGKELFYLTGDGDLMVVGVSVTGTKLDTTAPSKLFSTRAGTGTPGGSSFDVSQDGNRFLVLQPVDSRPTPITTILNWPSLIADAARR